MKGRAAFVCATDVRIGHALADGLVRHGIAPPNLDVTAGWLPIAAAVGGGVLAALLAVLGAGRRAARVPPTLALSDAAVYDTLAQIYYRLRGWL